MMIKLGFHEQWVDVIMKCVTTVTYRIKVNGELTDEIVPGRGLLQGIPSPHICFCCVLKPSHIYSMQQKDVENYKG
jgi:hypothetical protein